jgi:hypothetical protein
VYRRLPRLLHRALVVSVCSTNPEMKRKRSYQRRKSTTKRRRRRRSK